jgi:hypothetical protein
VCDIPRDTWLISLEGRDVTTFVGDVVGDPIWVQGVTVVGDLYSMGRCAIFIDNVVHGSVGIAIAGECDSGTGLVAFNTVDESITIAGFSLVWNNIAAGIKKGGRTPHFEALGNTLLEKGLSVRGGGLLKDNIIFNAPVGIHAESGTIGLRADIIGNRIVDSGSGIEILRDSGDAGGWVTIAGNMILGSRDFGIDHRLPGDYPVIRGNLITSGPPADGGPATGVGIRLTSSAAILENTVAGGETGVRIEVSATGPPGDVVVDFDSNIIGPNAGPGVELIGDGTVVAMRNDVHGNAPDWQGLDSPQGVDGNISLDPLFRDPAGGDWSIDPASPCIDTGSATGGSHDLAGRSRVIDGDMDGVGVQDMGAYEAVAEVLDLQVLTSPLRLDWPPNPHASSGFDLYSGRLSDIASGGLSGLTTEACSFAGTSYGIEGSSMPGDGTMYLIVPRGLVSGSPGADSEGHPRVLSELCP